MGKPAAIAGVAIAIVSGPTRAQSSPELSQAVPKPVDVVKGGYQMTKKREENLEALEGDPDELRSSGEPDAHLHYQFVDPSSVEEHSESIHLSDSPAAESEGAAGGTAEPQLLRPRAPIPAATEPRLVPRMPRMPEVAPVTPRKLGALPVGPPKRSVVPVPVRPLAPKPEVASAAVPLVAPKTEVASPLVRMVAPKTKAASPPEPTPELRAASVPEPDQAPAPESASEIAIPLIEAPEPKPNPDPASKRTYRPWLADAAESEPVEQEPER
jgi:hypothetical protein